MIIRRVSYHPPTVTGVTEDLARRIASIVAAAVVSQCPDQSGGGGQSAGKVAPEPQADR
jgi:hypothetical protein